jgi:CRISPR-associated protein Cas2
MPRKKKTPPIELFDLRNRGVDTKLSTEEPPQTDERTPLPIRVQQLIDFLSIENHKAPEEMYCFIMYDIEDNKVRRLVAKYLEKKGCMRVQKSIFFAKLHRKHYREITQTLKEIQDAYLNNDSILTLPVGEDMLNSLLIIGKELTYEFNRDQPNTLFF